MEEFFNQFSVSQNTLPQTLFHYTAQAGLLGIIQNETIWMTHTQYLNDTQEFHHALELIQSEIQHRLTSPADTKQENILNEMFSIVESSLSTVNICVCCFSEVGDSLSQWRAYGSPSSNYSIGFNPLYLESIASDNNFRLVKCIYDLDEKKKIVSDFVDIALSEVTGLHDNLEEDAYSYLLLENGFVANLLKLAPILKDSSFADEKEWRIISRPLSHNSVGFEFREGNSMIIPYYKLSLTYNAETDNQPITTISVGAPLSQPILSVYIGPTPNEVQSMNSVRSFLFSKANKFQNRKLIDITISSVPYRSW